MRKITAHYVFLDGRLVPDVVVAFGDDARVAGIERSQRRDGMCGVEFYSGILIPGMILPSADWSACRDVDFVRARLWSDGVQAVGEIRGSEPPLDMERLTFSHTVNLLMERYGDDVCGLADAATRRGACLIGQRDALGGFRPAAECGAVLLTGADYPSMRLTASAATVRIV